MAEHTGMWIPAFNAAMRDGRKIEAVKAYRVGTQSSLKEAVEYLRAVESGAIPAPTEEEQNLCVAARSRSINADLLKALEAIMGCHDSYCRTYGPGIDRDAQCMSEARAAIARAKAAT